jgi:fumarylacetoacetase
MKIRANDPDRKSWIEVSAQSDFPLQNLPFGTFKKKKGSPCAASALGNYVIDLHALWKTGLIELDWLTPEMLLQNNLNQLISVGKIKMRQLRNELSDIFCENCPEVKRDIARTALVPHSEVEMLMPVAVGNYTDFYSSKEHATNIGTMFRDPDNALLPNWLHIPVGYHGRASSIVVSGTDIRRPKGQVLPPDAQYPVYSPSKLLDFELELGFVIGKETLLGDPIDIADAENYIFGLVLFNDWSARDIQKWEYVPLGPFLGKNFASTISPWIVTLDALEPYRVAGPKQDPQVLPYLRSSGLKNYDIHLDVKIRTQTQAERTVCRSNFKYMYWNMCQQLAHHTVNGCNVQVGDIYASGTISGPDKTSYGSMLELSWKGTRPIEMPDGTIRKFIQDGDTVIMTGFAEKNNIRIGFGKASGTVLPALP